MFNFIKKLIMLEINKQLIEKDNIIERKNKLLENALIYLRDDVKMAKDLVELTSLKDMVFNIEEELNLPKEKRTVQERFGNSNFSKKNKHKKKMKKK